MRITALAFLFVTVVAGLFSFGFVNGIRWGPAQLIFGVSLILFTLTAIAGFTPSHQIRPLKAPSTTTRWLQSGPVPSAKFALLYVTVGALGLVWCGVWYWYLRNHPPEDDTVWYWCYGGLLTSLGALIVGLGIGRMFRAAQHAELPPEETTPATEKNEENRAAGRVSSVPPAAKPS